MNEVVQYLVRHGYYVLFLVVFGRQLCLPLPGILFLLAAGALAGLGKLNLTAVIAVSVIACVLADLAWYEAGRMKGNTIMHFLHGFSGASKPNFDIRKIFSQFGARSLLVSKFILGLDALAPPFAGMFGTSLVHFLAYDGLGSALWVGAYTGLGCAFSKQLDRAVGFAERFGTWMGLATLLAVLTFACRRIHRWHRFVSEYRLARITPQELKHKLDTGEKVIMVDLHGCPYHVFTHEGIPGAIRINPHRLKQYEEFPIPHDWVGHDVVLYCACPNESTSARVALALHRRGLDHIRPLEGGLEAWRELGFPIAPTIPTVTINALRKMNLISPHGAPTGEQLRETPR